MGNQINQPFHHENGLWPAGTAHGGRRDHIGKGDRDIHPIGRQPVGTRQGRSGDIRHDDAPGQVGPGVMNKMPFDPKDLPACRNRHRHVPNLITLLGGGHEVFAAVLDPFNWPAKQLRCYRHHHFFRIDLVFGTETTAHIGGDDTHFIFGHIEHIDQATLGIMWRLG